MLNFYRPFFMPCFGSHFENGRHLEKEKLAKKKIQAASTFNWNKY